MVLESAPRRRGGRRPPDHAGLPRSAPLRPHRARVERPRVRAQVRARRRGGAWSEWVALHPSDDHGPDAGRSDRATARAGAARTRSGPVRRTIPAAHRAQRPGNCARASSARLPPPARSAGGSGLSHAAAARRQARPRSSRERPGAATAWCRARRPVRPGPARVRPSHGDRERLRAGGLNRDRPRHRATTATTTAGTTWATTSSSTSTARSSRAVRATSTS